MKKNNVELIVNNKQYLWTSTGYDLTIWKEGKQVFYTTEKNYLHNSTTQEGIKKIIIDNNL